MNNRKGGKKINQGFKGMVIDMYSSNKEDEITLYRDLQKAKPGKITLLTKNENLEIDKKETEKILKLIKNSKDILVKKFIYVSFLFGTKEKNFNNELIAYKTLMKIFGKDISKHTTIKRGFKYNNKSIYGMIFDGNYYIFIEKCFKTLEDIKFTQDLYNKFIKEILETLNILNKYNYIHNDLKPDNIIMCKNRFKIIDWESSNEIKEQSQSFVNSKNGNIVFNHPIKFYNINVPFFMYKYIFNYEIMTYKYLDTLKYPKIIFDMVSKAFDKVVKHNKEYYKINDDKIEKSSLESPLISATNQKNIKKSKYFYLKNADYYSFAINAIVIAEKNKLIMPKKLLNTIFEPYFMQLT